jgi:hypothetical protein
MIDEHDSIQRAAEMFAADPLAMVVLALFVIAGIALVVWLVDRAGDAAE